MPDAGGSLSRPLPRLEIHRPGENEAGLLSHLPDNGLPRFLAPVDPAGRHLDAGVRELRRMLQHEKLARTTRDVRDHLLTPTQSRSGLASFIEANEPTQLHSPDHTSRLARTGTSAHR
jgi:hypothetical protein